MSKILLIDNTKLKLLNVTKQLILNQNRLKF